MRGIDGAQAERALEVIGPSAPVGRRPRLEPAPLRPPRVTAGFALGWALTLAVLGIVSAIWITGMVATTLFFVLGQGGALPVLVFGTTGLLLGRGWVGMVQSIRARLRRRDLDEPAALPPAFWALPVGLQRLVRQTRSLQIVVREPDVPLDGVDREMFEWLSSMAELGPAEQRFLEARGLVAPQLREELVHSRWSEDQAARRQLPALVRREARPRARAVDHRQHALAMLERFERSVLEAGRDPFRGSA
ncbi:MAG: hypothetical protein AB1Z98_30905 [Nannocystaceae bacterium]